MDNPASNRHALQLTINPCKPLFLESLATWQSLGLMSDEQLRHFCATVLSCPLLVSLPIRDSHPNLLVGLEQWLDQGALSDEQVLRWCQGHLSEPLPLVSLSVPQGEVSPQPPVQTPTQVGWVPTILQSLMDEISVLWLLFLGVFLVVVSSAVLAASQWHTVPPAGQYGILWAYTVAFWGVSHWLERKDNLQLTAHTLQLTSLLIIPVNFWMIDSFQLVQGGLSVFVALAAGLILSGLAAYTLNPLDRDRWEGGNRNGWLILMTLLLLSWLHWGWLKPWVPLFAIYLGIVATGVSTIWLHAQPEIAAPPPARYRFVELLALTPLYGVLLLLLRGVWIAQLPLSSFGLAFGLVGGIFCWMGRRPMLGASSWWLVGMMGILVGRFVTQSFDSHGQAVVVTAIAFWVLGDRLFRSWQPWLVGLLFIAGLQGLYPLYALVPVPVQDLILVKVAAIAGAQGHRSAVLSFLVLPYWWLTLGAADFLRSRRPQLVVLVERMALGLGIVLTLLTFANPFLRTLFLVCIAGTLLFRLRTQSSPTRIGLVHGLVLGAIASGIDTLFPTLAVEQWAMVWLGGMAGEFAGAAFGPARWQRSCWGAGLSLATLAYLFLLADRPYTDWPEVTRSPLEPIMAWLIPGALTALSFLRTFPQRRSAQGLSIFAMGMVQLLYFPFTGPRSIGFFIATALMGMLSLRMRRFFPALAAIGLLLTSGLNLFVSYAPRSALDWLWVILPLSSVGLGGASMLLCARRRGIAIFYRQACDCWSLFLNGVVVVGVAGAGLAAFSQPELVVRPLQWGAGGMVLSALFQFYRRPRVDSLYLVAIAVAACCALLAWLSPWPQDIMAMGWLLAGLGAFFCRRDLPKIAFYHWDIVPLAFAIAGWLMGHSDFQGYTGLYTMGGAFIGMLVGRRRSNLKPVTYVAIAALSFGIYELLVYQLLQAEGDYPGDALILFAGLATIVAIADRVLVRWSHRLLKLTPGQFLPVAHLHWLVATVFLGTALIAPMRLWAEMAWIGLMLTLMVYALIAGRVQSGFLYGAIGQGLAAIAFGVAQMLPLSLLGHWSGAIAVGLAALLYYFPWGRYGWEALPGQRMAIALPAGVVSLSLPGVGLSSLLLSGGWYFWVSQRPNRVRLSYLGLALGNWAIFRLVDRWFEVTPMWWALLLGCSLLLVVQWEPLLQTSQRREVRHWLRCGALGLMALMALYESDGYLGWSLATVLAGLLVGVGGLVFRMRSFLYVGTLLVVVKVLWMLWAFVTDHSFLLWALGILLGVVLIWIAATFESRRTQAIAFLDYWVDALQHWQ